MYAKSNEQVAEYCGLIRQLNLEYEEYARTVGLTHSSLRTLSIIYDNPDGCSQKTICDHSFLPKQTVNAIVTGFLKQGVIKLTELKTDRRRKTIRLTKRGLEYINPLFSKIKNAENKAMESLDAGQRAALLENTRLYLANFHERMKDDSK
ncbi:MAG: MarR family transcriptional regulator [Deltaproteobacteria bacterium]|jgi:DNA-binding MarR family transcriptional regulator|nr:MarR family transcriptional regulator [Deltaproteobacteria bacterium]